jgi:hypothetical protein
MIASQPSAMVANQPYLALPDKPSIAVLPFANMSSDPEQDFFADRDRRGRDHRIVALSVLVRHRPQFVLHLQEPCR